MKHKRSRDIRELPDFGAQDPFMVKLNRRFSLPNCQRAHARMQDNANTIDDNDPFVLLDDVSWQDAILVSDDEPEAKPVTKQPCSITKRRSCKPTDGPNIQQTASLPITTDAQEEDQSPTCAICLGRLNDSRRRTYALACGHVFHAQEIDEWLAIGTKCPMCNKEVPTKHRRLAKWRCRSSWNVL